MLAGKQNHILTLTTFLKFLRWQNLVLMGLLLVVYDAFIIDPIREILGLEAALSNGQFALLVVDVICVALTGYWLNDISDAEIDRINRPERMLVQRPDLKNWVVIAICALSVIGAAITVYLGVAAGKLKWLWLYPFCMVMLFWYAKNGKRWSISGNIVVSLLIAALPVLLLISESDAISRVYIVHPDLFERLALIVGAYMIMMFFANNAREIAKDAEDVNGDNQISQNSIPLRWGIGVTKWTIALHLAAVALVQWCLLLWLEGGVVLLAMTVVITLFCIRIATKTMHIYTFSGFKWVSAAIKTLMLFGVFQLLFLLEYLN